MDNKTLYVTHNAGFFSCCTIALIEVIKYFNRHKQLPEVFDRSQQFAFFKADLRENIIDKLFEEGTNHIEHERELVVTNEAGEISFGDYSRIHFDDVKPFIERYFAPSKTVRCIMNDYVANYGLDFDNLCAVFYRGNDKQKECLVTNYQDFIDKAKEMPEHVKFLVCPDETEMWQAFHGEFGERCILIKETPHMRRKNSAIFYELPPNKKTEHACNFLAAVITMSKCKYAITHSGNGSLFLALYRGNMNNVHQFRNEHIYQ